MWSRRDQLQAYQFLRRRLVSAVLLGDANHPESPSRRSVMSTVTGVVVTMLLLAGFGVWGAITQSTSADWRAGGQVIVEKDNYAHYVLGAQDGALHPALNYTSALLFLGRQSPTVTLSRATIATAAQGRTIGIVGAPQALPAAAALLTGPWTVCARTATGVAGRVTPTVNLSVGMPETGTPLGVQDALLVQDAGSSRTLYLVTQGRRFAVASPAVALSLGYRTPPIPVATAWLNALPAGPTLRYLTEPTGVDGPVVAGVAVPVGQVITVSDPGRPTEYYVYRADGLTPVSETEYRLITGNPALTVRSRPLTRGELGALPYSATRATRMDLGYPDPLPQAWSLPTGAVALCATAPADPGRSQLMAVTVRLDLPATGTPTGAAPLAQNLADDVTVPSTRGAVVHTSQGAGFVSETSYLVTDEGRRYLIPGATELGILGYGGRALPAVPETMLAMLPQGPRLDQESARKQWPVVAGSPSASAAAPTTTATASPTSSAAASVRTGRLRTTTGRTP